MRNWAYSTDRTAGAVVATSCRHPMVGLGWTGFDPPSLRYGAAGWGRRLKCGRWRVSAWDFFPEFCLN